MLWSMYLFILTARAVTSEYLDISNFYLALCSPLFVISPCPVRALCSTPLALWHNCLFRPCWVGCPVLKGILFCSCSQVSVSLRDFKGFIWVEDMWVCVWRGPCEYISWSDQLPPNIKATQAQREAGLQVIYKNIFQYMCTQIAKVLNTNAGIAGCWCYSQEVII